MDTSLAKPAKGTAKREKACRRHRRISRDIVESNQVKARSGGRCEVVVVMTAWCFDGLVHRCQRRATQVHHMIGGRGRRAVGPSALAAHKQHVCDRCHEDITGDVGGKKLFRVGGPVPHYTDMYRRVK